MKQVLLALALVLSASIAQAQQIKPSSATPALPIDPDTHLVAYTGVVEMPGLTHVQLYERALAWVNQHYPAASSGVQDKEAGKIIVQGVTYAHAHIGFASSVTHTLSLYVKDGKYKYDFTNFRNEAKSGDDIGLGAFENEKVGNVLVRGAMQKPWNSLRNETGTQIQALITSLDAEMKGAKTKSDF
jgi:hypothetical protein